MHQLNQRMQNLPSWHRRRRGLSLLEVTVSTLLVGLIVVSAMKSLGASIQSGESATNRTLATLLAENLMEEILQQDYSEPIEAAVFGIEATESSLDRLSWDDVDDYDNWSASPPVDAVGTAVADDTWERRVTVKHVEPADLSAVQSDANDTGVKRIIVTVSRDGVDITSLTTIQTRAWISMIPEAGKATTTGQLPPANQPPTATYTQSAVVGSGSVVVDFDGRNSTDPENEPLEFNWDFGDSGTTTGEIVSHTFVNSGGVTVIYTITLTVKDIHGGTDTSTSTVTVLPDS